MISAMNVYNHVIATKDYPKAHPIVQPHYAGFLLSGYPEKVFFLRGTGRDGTKREYFVWIICSNSHVVGICFCPSDKHGCVRDRDPSTQYLVSVSTIVIPEKETLTYIPYFTCRIKKREKKKWGKKNFTWFDQGFWVSFCKTVPNRTSAYVISQSRKAKEKGSGR